MKLAKVFLLISGVWLGLAGHTFGAAVKPSALPKVTSVSTNSLFLIDSISGSTHTTATMTMSNLARQFGLPVNLSSNAIPGTVHPSQFGAAGDGLVDLSHGLGNVQAALVNGTDDGPAFNAMFNAVTNGPGGTIIDGENKLYFINTPIFLTNSGGGPLQLQNIGFVSTNRTMVTITTGIGRMHWRNCGWFGTTNATSSVGISNDWSYTGVISDYVVANTMSDCMWKGGFWKDMVLMHNTNPKLERCLLGNFASNGVHSVLCDQVMYDGCVFGYTFDATGGTLSNELTGGGNKSWTNGLSLCVDGGIVTTIKNCENNTSGTFLHAANTIINFDVADIEQCYCPPTSAVCWLTNCILNCSGYVNFINNNSGISNNVTTWKLDNCPLASCVIRGNFMPVTTNPQIDLFGQGGGARGFPYIFGQRNGLIVRQHASWALPNVAGVDSDLTLGTVPSLIDGNIWGGPHIWTNIAAFQSGLVGDFQVGANYGQRGLITPDFASGHAFYMRFPSTSSSVADRTLMGARSFGGLTHMFLGSDIDNNPGVTDITFQISPTDGAAATTRMTLTDGGLTSDTLVNFRSGLVGDFQVGANYGQRGTVTADFGSGHAFYMRFPSTSSTVADRTLMGARAFGGLTKLYLGSDVDNNPGATDLNFLVSATDGGTPVQKMTVDNTGVTVAGGLIANIGFLIKSNTLASIPALTFGDVYLYSLNGIAFRILVGPTGTRTTNTW